MRLLQLKKLYLPAVSILAVVLILLILIGISTYRNINREEQTTLKFVHQQGLTIIMVTHESHVAQRAERVIILSDGKIVSDKRNGSKLVRPAVEVS